LSPPDRVLLICFHNLKYEQALYIVIFCCVRNTTVPFTIKYVWGTGTAIITTITVEANNMKIGPSTVAPMSNETIHQSMNYTYIFKMNVCLSVLYVFLQGWTDFDDNFGCVFEWFPV